MKQAEEYIYRVAFKEPPLADDERKDFFFHSVAAIYEVFAPEQIGCKVTRLWNLGVSQGNAYHGRLCDVTKEPIMRKKRKSAPVGVDSSSLNNLHEKEI